MEKVYIINYLFFPSNHSMMGQNFILIRERKEKDDSDQILPWERWKRRKKGAAKKCMCKKSLFFFFSKHPPHLSAAAAVVPIWSQNGQRPLFPLHPKLLPLIQAAMLAQINKLLLPLPQLPLTNDFFKPETFFLSLSFFPQYQQQQQHFFHLACDTAITIMAEAWIMETCFS